MYEHIGISNCIFISALGHPLKFTDGRVLNPNAELAKLLTARAVEKEHLKFEDVSIVTTNFETDKDSIAKLEKVQLEFEQHYPGYKIFFVGSIIATKVNWGTKIFVVSPIVTQETLRLPPDQKVCVINRWNS